jgi:hypothetical protein
LSRGLESLGEGFGVRFQPCSLLFLAAEFRNGLVAHRSNILHRWAPRLQLAGKAADAESVFRECVKRSPRNGRMLFGLMESQRAQGKDEDAGWVKLKLEEM